MFNFKFFHKEKWALVGTLRLNKTAYCFHIHLFESDTGKRKAEYIRDGHPTNKFDQLMPLYNTDLYQERIYRWLNGRVDPDILRYNQCAENDTMNMLTGKIS